MKKYIIVILSIFVLALICISPIVLQKVISIVTLSTSGQTTLELGASTTLQVINRDSKVKWSSSNDKIVKVDLDGTITAVGLGSTIITADVDGYNVPYKVIVYEDPLRLSASSVTLNVDKKDFINVINKNNGKVNEEADWTTNDSSVATVSEIGVISGVGIGTADITATIEGKSYTCKVVVNERISLNKSSLTLQQGQTHQLNFKGISYRAEWNSSNSSIAYISMDGKVTGVSAGTATITGRVDGTDYTCSVTVTKLPSINQKSLLVYEGDKKTKLFVPDATSDTSIKWSSDNEDSVTVSSDGALKVQSPGVATITATVGNNRYTYLIVGASRSHPYLNNAPIPCVEKIQDKLNFVVPKSWSYDYKMTKNGFEITVKPNVDSSSGIVITITRPGIPSIEYYTFKNIMYTEKNFNERAVLSDIHSSIKHKKSVLKDFKQENYLSSHGNCYMCAFRVQSANKNTDKAYYYFGMSINEVCYAVKDGGDTPNFSAIAEYVLNSFYVMQR